MITFIRPLCYNYTLTETTIVSCRAPFLCDLDGAGYQNRRRNHGSHSDSSNQFRIRLVAAAISFKPNWNAGTAVSILCPTSPDIAYYQLRDCDNPVVDNTLTLQRAEYGWQLPYICTYSPSKRAGSRCATSEIEILILILPV